MGDRQRLLGIGMAAVWGSCVVFGTVRLVGQLISGRSTPWWANALGGALIAGLYAWYRRDPARRSGVGVHGTALTATLALVVPSFYGMASSKWWLALVGFGVTLLGRRREAVIWVVATLFLVPAVALVEPSASGDVAGSAGGEPRIEAATAAFFFVALLLFVTWSFRREAERRARAMVALSTSLAHANQVKARFLAHVSHEVRTPLHTVIAMNDLVLRGELPASARDQMETAHASAQMLLALLNNILDVTRVESQAIALESRPFALHQALSEILAPLAAQARAQGLAFTASAVPGLVAERVGDRVRVGQIVVNLVGNALKFTERGSVHVDLRGSGGDPDLITIVVTDTGRGIAADDLDAVFQPFFGPVAPEDDRRRGGVGLGLSIVKELAKRMSGDVTVTSTPERGSCFTVQLRLPRQGAGGAAGPVDLLERSRPAAVAFARTEPADERLRVLVCEDNEWVRKAFRMTLIRMGHQATLTGTGEEAIAALAEKDFDVLITDLDMPGMDGVELTSTVRQRRDRERGRRLPIVAVTGHSGGAEEERLIQAGADAFLAKPFELADLAAALERALAAAR